MALTAATERALARITDERIELEETRQRAEAKKQSAAHLEDLRREMVTPLKSIWTVAEADTRPLVR